MRNILLINSLVEGLAGFVLIMMPHVLLLDKGQAIQAIAISRLYGMLALAFGILSWILYKKFEYNRMYKHVCLLILAFHFAVALYCNSLHQQGLMPSQGAFFLHLIMSIGFLGLYLKDINKFSADE